MRNSSGQKKRPGIGPLTGKERERLSRPLSKQEQKKALAALEAAEQFSAQLRERRGGGLYPDSAEIVRKMREGRTLAGKVPFVRWIGDYTEGEP